MEAQTKSEKPTELARQCALRLDNEFGFEALPMADEVARSIDECLDLPALLEREKKMREALKAALSFITDDDVDASDECAILDHLRAALK